MLQIYDTTVIARVLDCHRGNLLLRPLPYLCRTSRRLAAHGGRKRARLPKQISIIWTTVNILALNIQLKVSKYLYSKYIGSKGKDIYCYMDPLGKEPSMKVLGLPEPRCFQPFARSPRPVFLFGVLIYYSKQELHWSLHVGPMRPIMKS